MQYLQIKFKNNLKFNEVKLFEITQLHAYLKEFREKEN